MSKPKRVTRREFIKKAAALAGVAAVGVPLLQACAPAEPTATPVPAAPTATPVPTPVPKKAITLTFWKAPHTDNEEALWHPIVAGFEALHPNIKIEHVVTPWATWDQQYTSAFAATPPDTLYMINWWAPKFVEANQLVDFDAAGISDQVKDQYYPNLWDEASMYRGKHYGIPWMGVPRFLFYHQDLFDGAGIGKPPDTWDEFLEDAQKLTKGDRYGFVFPSTAEGFGDEWFLQWLWAAGGELVSEDGTKAAFNSDAGVKALQFVADWFTKYKIVPPAGLYGAEASEDAWLRAVAAMAINRIVITIRLQKDFPNAKWAVSIPPAAEGGRRGFPCDWGYIAIAEKSPNKEAAAEWATYITGKEPLSSYLSATPMFPGRKDVEIFKGLPTWELFKANTDKAHGFPLHPLLPKIRQLWWAEAEKAILGQLSAKEAADAGAEKVNKMLAEEYKPA